MNRGNNKIMLTAFSVIICMLSCFMVTSRITTNEIKKEEMYEEIVINAIDNEEILNFLEKVSDSEDSDKMIRLAKDGDIEDVNSLIEDNRSINVLNIAFSYFIIWLLGVVVSCLVIYLIKEINSNKIVLEVIVKEE